MSTQRSERAKAAGAKAPETAVAGAIMGEVVVRDLAQTKLPHAPALRAMPQSLASLGKHGYSQDEIHSLVVPKRTLARRAAHHEPLSIEETDKALRLERVATLAARVFGNVDKANRWLRKPKHQLNGKTPLAYLMSEAGARLVEDMLQRIDHGILA